jgi:hypothetical protein
VIVALKGARSRSWASLISGAAACAVALSFHYAALFVVVPLCVWMLSRRELSRSKRLTFCAIPGATLLAWLPLALSQHRDHPNAQLGSSGNLTRGHVVRVVGAPFDDRYSMQAGALKAVAAALVLGAIALVIARIRRERSPELWLMVAIVVAPIVALLTASALGIEVLNSRYMTPAVPFMAIVLAAAIGLAGRAGLAALAVLVAVAIVGDVGSHRRAGFYPDTRGVVATVDSGWRAGDLVLEDTSLGVMFPLKWYAEKRLPAGARVLHAGDPRARGALSNRPRLWIVQQVPPLAGRPSQRPQGYRTLARRRFAGTRRLQLELASASPRR